MKIQTNEGPVELTTEMVCKGMVFEDDEGINRMTVGDGSYSEQGQREAAALLDGLVFLGCNPEIASRADCERFGVHGDAAAHGFARLQGGGAVDLRRKGAAPEGSVYMHRDGGPRFKTSAHVALTEAMRFLGLNADHASPEDVRRLCCLAPKDGDIGSAVRCTLAIGKHEQHEDFATGVKWNAGADRYFSADGGGNDSVETGAIRAFCAFVAGLKRWAASSEGKRAAQERALVALVNAVPEGLDPVGWQAAVLACVEHKNGNASDVKTETFYYALLRAHHRAARGETKNRLFISCGNPFECAVDSYLRAITPAPPVPRVRATWKTRGPVLAVDDGRDE